MTQILLSYLAYNILLGVVLTAIFLIKDRTLKEPRLILWLLLFPAIGLGYWKHAEAEQHGTKPLFPKNWFMWKYMVSVNWGFMGIIAVLPGLLMVLSAFGFLLAGEFSMDGFGMMTWPEIRELLSTSLLLFGFLYALFMLFALIIPYILFIGIPKSQMRSIERKELMHATRQRSDADQAPSPAAKPIPLLPEIHIYVLSCIQEFKTIPVARKKALEGIAEYISKKMKQQEAINLVFICTHNSRRSQFGQIWAATAAAFHGIRNIQTYSGGTEETAFNKRAVDAIKRAGFKVDGTIGTNPRYSVRFSDETGALDCFSKTVEHATNPQKGFAAIMTCSDADTNCPVVIGSEFRARITYEDPKVSDRTESEAATYDERCKQIATEMLYLFSKV